MKIRSSVQLVVCLLPGKFSLTHKILCFGVSSCIWLRLHFHINRQCCCWLRSTFKPLSMAFFLYTYKSHTSNSLRLNLVWTCPQTDFWLPPCGSWSKHVMLTFFLWCCLGVNSGVGMPSAEWDCRWDLLKKKSSANFPRVRIKLSSPQPLQFTFLVLSFTLPRMILLYRKYNCDIWISMAIM